MSNHITGQRARDLLVGTTPGPWKADFAFADITPVFEYDADDELDWSTKADHELATAAPDLAATVAWLYGREADGHKLNEDIPAWSVSGCPDFMEGDEKVWLPTFGGRITLDRIEGNFTPKQAIELARALLAAAAEARRDQ